MSEDKILKYRELKQLLAKHGVTENKHGKGSHRSLNHPNINGRRVRYTMSVHHEGQEIPAFIVRYVRRVFNVSYEEFYQ